jgi:hypothetical protein
MREGTLGNRFVNELFSAFLPYVAFSALVLWGLNHLMAHHRAIAELDRRLDVDTRVKAAAEGFEKALAEAKKNFEERNKETEAKAAAETAKLREDVWARIKLVSDALADDVAGLRKRANDELSMTNAHVSMVQGDARKRIDELDARIQSLDSLVNSMPDVQFMRNIRQMAESAKATHVPGP